MPRRPLGYPMPPVCGFFSTSLQRQPWPSFLLLFSCFHTESQLPRGFSAQEISHSKGSHSVEPPGPPGKAVVWISTPVWHKDTWQPRVLSALWLHEVSKIQRGSKGWRLSGREWADTVYTRRGQDQKWEGLHASPWLWNGTVMCPLIPATGLQWLLWGPLQMCGPVFICF